MHSPLFWSWARLSAWWAMLVMDWCWPQPLLWWWRERSNDISWFLDRIMTMMNTTNGDRWSHPPSLFVSAVSYHWGKWLMLTVDHLLHLTSLHRPFHWSWPQYWALCLANPEPPLLPKFPFRLILIASLTGLTILDVLHIASNHFPGSIQSILPSLLFYVSISINELVGPSHPTSCPTLCFVAINL